MFPKIKSLFNDFLTTLKDIYYLNYLIKCIIGASICYTLYKFFPNHQLVWSVISVLLVLAPDHKDSARLATDRIKANIIGASIGLLAFMAHQPNLFTFCCAIIATIFFCTFIKLGNPSRSALAALTIVFIHEKEKRTWIAAAERMSCVFIGCFVALIITIIFNKIETIIKNKKTPGTI